jgi:hypothetical protein
VPVAAVAEMVQVSATSFKTIARALEDPLNVCVAVNVFTDVATTILFGVIRFERFAMLCP